MSQLNHYIIDEWKDISLSHIEQDEFLAYGAYLKTHHFDDYANVVDGIDVDDLIAALIERNATDTKTSLVDLNTELANRFEEHIREKLFELELDNEDDHGMTLNDFLPKELAA